MVQKTVLNLRDFEQKTSVFEYQIVIFIVMYFYTAPRNGVQLCKISHSRKKAICYARAKTEKKQLILRPKAQLKISKKTAVFSKNTRK